ncbi:MAG: exodeoxyribonuclease V subunit gamma, partial [Actinomycetota bacterium]|nr:exodeoxyribonuclease V subunit gamma [Actinomycetota bacterium]
MLHVHRAERADTLVDALASVLTTPLGDPFAPDLVAVPAKGVERWLAQRLSHVLGAGTVADGVCANVTFPRPSEVLDEALAAVAADHAEVLERWTPDRLVWPLLEVIDETAHKPWCQQLARHLGVDVGVDKGRRFAVASRLARLLDSYGNARPQLLTAWAAGEQSDGAGNQVDADLGWQVELFRRLRDRVGHPAPAELLPSLCSAVVEQHADIPLPERLSVFGATRISAARLQVLTALAEHRELYLWVPHASPALWHAVGATPPTSRLRRDDDTALRLDNRLLASLSRDVRELQQLLASTAPQARHEHHPSPPRPETLLGHLQDDLAQDRVRTDPPPLKTGDRSVQVHACHGRSRQVEVLREAVLHLLQQDTTLEPRDVLVMCPDVETFAPLIAASFGQLGDDVDGHPASRLRVRLADRALRQTNPLLALLSVLLELGEARVSASQVLDLTGTAVVRERFRLDDDDVERLREWVGTAAVRWGLDASHRGRWQLGKVDQGTWRWGLDRLLLGAAMEERDEGFSRALPVDDVDSADIDRAGRFAELVERLHAAIEAMQHART